MAMIRLAQTDVLVNLEAEREHKLLSASKAHQWMVCTACIGACKSLPPTPSSPSARKGTMQHAVNDLALRSFLEFKESGIGPEPWEDKIIENDEVGFSKDEAIANANLWVNFIWEEVLERSITNKAWGIEDEFTYREDLGIGGITDFWVAYISDKGERTLAIVDYKNGFFKVQVKNNSQLLTYALSANEELTRAKDGQQKKSFDKFVTGVFQPNAWNKTEKPIHSYTRKQLRSFEQKLLKAAAAIYNGKAKFKAGEHCQFCPIKPACKTHIEWASKKACLPVLDKKGVINIPHLDVSTLPDEQLKALALHGHLLEDLVSEAKAYCIARYTAGKPVAGTKVIQTPGKRAWIKDESKVVRFFRDLQLDPYQKPKLITITQAEKILGEGKLFEITQTGKGSQTLTSEDDPRAGIQDAISVLGELK